MVMCPPPTPPPPGRNKGMKVNPLRLISHLGPSASPFLSFAPNITFMTIIECIRQFLCCWGELGTVLTFSIIHLICYYSICTIVTVKIKVTACGLYNVYHVIVVTTGHPWLWQLYHGRVQGVSVHSPSHSII